MSEHIYAEFNTFCYAIMLGAMCGILYDFIRIFRRVIKKRMVITFVEDIIYWFIVSILFFMLMYRENGGMVRGFAIIGMAIGMILYEVSIGKFFVKYISIFMNYILNRLSIGINKLMKILKRVLKKLLKPFTIIVRLYRDKSIKIKKKHEENKQKAKKKKEDKNIDREKKGKVNERGSKKNKGKKEKRKPS